MGLGARSCVTPQFHEAFFLSPGYTLKAGCHLVDACGSCGFIEEPSPLGGVVSPFIRDLESRRDVLTGQSAGWALVNATSRRSDRRL